MFHNCYFNWRLHMVTQMRSITRFHQFSHISVKKNKCEIWFQSDWKCLYYIFFVYVNDPRYFYKCMYVRMSLFSLMFKTPHFDCCWWMYTSRCFSWFLIYVLDAGEMEGYTSILQTCGTTIITISLSNHSSLGVRISEYQCWNIYKYAMCTISVPLSLQYSRCYKY